MEAVSATTTKLRKGDVVEVRSAAEILATLDDRGERDALPFMPEMVAMCGRRFVVAARAERICDTITAAGVRAMEDTVVLESAACDGSGHGGCAAACLLYWKEDWLRKADRIAPVRADDPADDTARASLLELTQRNAKSEDAQRRALPVSGDAGERCIDPGVQEGPEVVCPCLHVRQCVDGSFRARASRAPS